MIARNVSAAKNLPSTISVSRTGEVLSSTIEWFCRSSASSRNDSSTPAAIGTPLAK